MQRSAMRELAFKLVYEIEVQKEVVEKQEAPKEEFVPMNENEVKMYACGITVYDDCHIGHAKQAVTFDIIKRYLEYRGYNVTYARNYTDVDDKILKKAEK